MVRKFNKESIVSTIEVFQHRQTPLFNSLLEYEANRELDFIYQVISKRGYQDFSELLEVNYCQETGRYVCYTLGEFKKELQKYYKSSGITTEWLSFHQCKAFQQIVNLTLMVVRTENLVFTYRPFLDLYDLYVKGKPGTNIGYTMHKEEGVIVSTYELLKLIKAASSLGIDYKPENCQITSEAGYKFSKILLKGKEPDVGRGNLLKFHPFPWMTTEELEKLNLKFFLLSDDKREFLEQLEQVFWSNCSYSYS